jgi:hypothetical protein
VATTLIQNSDMSRADEYVKNCVLCKEGTSREETPVASSVVGKIMQCSQVTSSWLCNPIRILVTWRSNTQVTGWMQSTGSPHGLFPSGFQALLSDFGSTLCLLPGTDGIVVKRATFARRQLQRPQHPR